MQPITVCGCVSKCRFRAWHSRGLMDSKRRWSDLSFVPGFRLSSIFTPALKRTEPLPSFSNPLLSAASGCGENLYMSSSKRTWSVAIQAWYDEVKDWRYGAGSVNGGVVGHFTQVRRAHRSTGGRWDRRATFRRSNLQNGGASRLGNLQSFHSSLSPPQVVWYRSNQLGCAMAHCPSSTFKYFYVCHYCPP